MKNLFVLGLILLSFAACEKDEVIEEDKEAVEIETLKTVDPIVVEEPKQQEEEEPQPEEAEEDRTVYPKGMYCAKYSHIDCIEVFEDYYYVIYNDSRLAEDKFNIDEMGTTVQKDIFKYSITPNVTSYKIYLEWYDYTLNDTVWHTKFFYLKD